MSDTCGDCSCADRSQCVKKGNQYGFKIIETHETYSEFTMNEGAENGCKCKCGGACTCTNCTCH